MARTKRQKSEPEGWLVAYARVSKAEANGASLDTQRRMIDTWAEMTGRGPIRYSLEDDGVSGGVRMEDRPGGRAALEAARAPGCGGLVVAKVDRLSRSLRETLEIVEDCGVQIISASEQFDTTTPMGKALLSMLGLFAEFERGKIRERTREALLTMKERGRYHAGGRPFGFRVRYEETVRRGLPHSIGYLEPCPEEEAVIRGALAMLESQRPGAVCSILNARGITTPKGAQWTPKTLRRTIQRWESIHEEIQNGHRDIDAGLAGGCESGLEGGSGEADGDPAGSVRASRGAAVPARPLADEAAGGYGRGRGADAVW